MQTLNGRQEKQIIHKTTCNNTATLLVHYLAPRHTRLIQAFFQCGLRHGPHILQLGAWQPRQVPQRCVVFATKKGVEAVVTVTRTYSS